jgi:pectate lyase
MSAIGGIGRAGDRLRTIVLFLGAILAVSLAGAGVSWSAPCDTAATDCPEVAQLLAQREGDSGPGTLRDILARATGPLWIRFASDMAIDLHSQIGLKPNITIDGRGHSVTLHDWGLTLSGGADSVQPNWCDPVQKDVAALAANR